MHVHNDSLFFLLFPKGNWLSLIDYSCCKCHTQIFSMLIYIFISALSSTDISLKFQENYKKYGKQVKA